MNALHAQMAALSALDQSSFVSRLDGIFEHSPWVAERAWLMRPFGALEELQQALCRCMRDATHEEKLALICAHPELAGRAAMRGEMAEASVREQAGARLDACSPEEYARLHQLNALYREKFGFPFILAVRGLNRAEIIASFASRLENSPEQEFEQALYQIERIASFRLSERFAAKD